MTGTLGLFSLVDLFQLLASSARTGRLLIDHPEGEARVYFDKGRVVHAEFALLRGAEAVFALFQDERGSFIFNLGLPSPETSIHVGTENLLLDAIRRLDESRQQQSGLEPSVSDSSVPFFADGAAMDGSFTLDAKEVLVLRLVDARRDLRQIAQESQLELAEIRELIARLVRVGALALRERKPRVARLVAQLSNTPLATSTVEIDSAILLNWENLLGEAPQRVACRRPDGKVDVFLVTEAESVGPYIRFSRDTLMAGNLAVDTPLLVKPLVDVS